MRESQAQWPKEPQWPDERIARAVGALRSTIPKRLDELLDEIELIPEDMRAASASAREIARLRRLLAVAAEEPPLPLEKNNERPISAEVLVQLLDAHYDRAYGPSRAWAALQRPDSLPPRSIARVGVTKHPPRSSSNFSGFLRNAPSLQNRD